MTRFVAIKPGKRIRAEFEPDNLFMTPVKRSLRNRWNQDKAPSGHSRSLSSLIELPNSINLVYCPNKALLHSC